MANAHAASRAIGGPRRSSNLRPQIRGPDLTILKRLFRQVGAGAIAALVRAKPTGSYARRIWFLYEWLTGARLELPDAATGTMWLS